MAEIIPPLKTVTVTFSLEPAYNASASLSLLDMADDFSGLPDWVVETVTTLSPGQRRTHKIVLMDISTYLGGVAWPSFPAWVDDLEARDATEMRDQALQAWLEEAREVRGDAIPAPSELLSDRAAYLALVGELCRHKGEACDLPMWEEVHRLLNDPPARQDLLVTHLRTMWDEVLAPEWERNLPMLEESIAAFQSLDLAGLTAVEALRRVILRDIPPASRLSWLEEAEHIIFIPSAHAGPYLLRLGGNRHGVERLVFGARIPEGARVTSPALSRSELLMRLNALTNDTRLRILALLAAKGELSTPDIMAQLDLSQSAASRHLEHLTAAGYVTARRPESTKLHRINPDRIDYTFRALKGFLQGAPDVD
jgi:DNA-binding transcriptional ArsR family regulator